MKGCLALTFGFHLLLGTITLSGIPLERPLTSPVVLETEAMSMVMTPVAHAVSAQTEESASCETTAERGCPTERCVAQSDNDGAPLETRSLVRPLSHHDVIVCHGTEYCTAAKELGYVPVQEQTWKTFAFHVSSVILRE